MIKRKLYKHTILFALCLFASLMFFEKSASAVTDTQKDTIFKLTSIFENSTPELQYTYIEDISDGRGYTFGFAGFCSGTYDGTMFLKKYQSLNPTNILVKYIDDFEYIDSLPHPDGMCSDISRLSGFINDFKSCANDPLFKQAQHALVDELYWNPSQNVANAAGATYPITYGELYDSCINHGEDGAQDIVNQTNAAVGSITSGTNEKVWLNKFLSIRLELLQSDSTWEESVDRVKVYQKLLNTDNNVNLTRPITVTCYGDTFTINGSEPLVAATPTFGLAGGTYTSSQSVAISSATSGATVKYTTDGSTPTSSSATYTGPITVSVTTTIKALAIKSGMTNSAIASATYTINTTGVTFYKDISFSGTAVSLQKGSYTLAQLNAAGIPNNWMSSLKVPSGWTVEVYDGDNFTGTKWTYTADSSWIGTAANDKMTSVVIKSTIQSASTIWYLYNTAVSGATPAGENMQSTNSSLTGWQPIKTITTTSSYWYAPAETITYSTGTWSFILWTNNPGSTSNVKVDLYKVSLSGDNVTLISSQTKDIFASGYGNHATTYTFSGITSQSLSNQRLLIVITKTSGTDATMCYNTNDFPTRLVTP